MRIPGVASFMAGCSLMVRRHASTLASFIAPGADEIRIDWWQPEISNNKEQ